MSANRVYDGGVTRSLRLRPFFAAAFCLSLALTGCNAERDRGYEMATSDTPLSPLTKEYMLAAQRGFYYLSLAHSWRTVSDRPRDGKIMHIETELQCPDQFHLRITGPVDMERTILGTRKFERRNGGAWEVSEVGSSPIELGRCQSLDEMRNRRPPDEAQIELYPGIDAAMKVVKGPVREYQGVKCQEYTVSWDDENARKLTSHWETRGTITNCYAVEGDPYLVSTKHAESTLVTYDLNKPVHVAAPAVASQKSVEH